MGLDSPAEVVAIDPCPEIEPDDGTGRNVVTGTMAHPAANILHLDITGLDEPLGVTATHPIWSETRHDFIHAGQLEIGEQFRTLTGESATLTAIHPHRGPPETVFNLEVDAQHVYLVADGGLLVHNECPFERFMSADEYAASISRQGLDVNPIFNGKFKNVADAGSLDPKTLGSKWKKFFSNKATFELNDGARDWLMANGVKPQLGHDRNTWQIPAHLVDQFNDLFVSSVR